MEKIRAVTTIDKRVLARIKGIELVEEQIGKWTNFEDSEVISIQLDRSPYPDGITRDLRAVFFIFDINQSPSSPERRPAHVEILFNDIDELKIEGFNHQNPIAFLDSKIIFCERLKRERLLVEWGGTALLHEVRFQCDSITIVRVTDLDPFRRGAVKPA